MKKFSLITGLLFISLLLVKNSFANGLPWQYQQHPFDFIFGNHIDTHQQTKIMPNGELKGYLYIEFTGEYTSDGYPVAKHTNCDDELAECTVGWQWRGVPGEATFVYHESGDHPICR